MNTIEAPLYLGSCSVCGSVKEFTDPKVRDGWEKFHPHFESYEEGEW